MQVELKNSHKVKILEIKTQCKIMHDFFLFQYNTDSDGVDINHPIAITPGPETEQEIHKTTV